MTDGGWNTGGEERGDERGDDAPDADPFIWGSDRDGATGPDDADRTTEAVGSDAEGPVTGSPDARPNGGAVRPDDAGGSPAPNGVEDAPDRTMVEDTPTGNPPARTPPRDASGADVIPEAVEEVERQLDRLESIAETLSVETINANIKRVQGETDELKAVHDELEAQARAVERTTDRLEDRLEEIREAFRRRRRERPAGRSGWGRRDRPTIPASPRPPARVDPTRPAPPRATGSDGGLVLDDLPKGDPEMGEAADPPGEPVEFLVPGTELRDMWRVRSQSGDGKFGGVASERWILETTPRMVEEGDEPSSEVVDIPPEVAEFTLDPDEMSFDELLAVAREDD